jgi:CHAT domain-containing protein
MRCFHERRLADDDTAGAIAAAAAEIRRTRPHPWYWAGFTAIGDSR